MTYIIENKEYIQVRELGKGVQGTAYLVNDINNQLYVLKLINGELKDKYSGKSCIIPNTIQHEAKIAHIAGSSPSDNVTFFQNSNQDEPDQYGILYYYLGTPLSKYLQENRLAREEQYDLAIKMTLALRKLHQHDIAHLDIKPDNITIDKDRNVHFIDFGCSKKLSDPVNYLIIGTTTYLPKKPEQHTAIQLDYYALIRVFGFLNQGNFLYSRRDKNGSYKTRQELRQKGNGSALEEQWVFDDDIIDNELSDLIQLAQREELSKSMTSIDYLVIRLIKTSGISIENIMIKNIISEYISEGLLTASNNTSCKKKKLQINNFKTEAKSVS